MHCVERELSANFHDDAGSAVILIRCRPEISGTNNENACACGHTLLIVNATVSVA